MKRVNIEKDIIWYMDQFIVIGLIAGFITTLSYTPQAVKGYRSKSMDDVSIYMPVILMVGLGLWFIYGIIIEDIPIIFWNTISVVLNAFIILMKLRYGKQKKDIESSINR